MFSWEVFNATHARQVWPLHKIQATPKQCIGRHNTGITRSIPETAAPEATRQPRVISGWPDLHKECTDECLTSEWARSGNTEACLAASPSNHHNWKSLGPVRNLATRRPLAYRVRHSEWPLILQVLSAMRNNVHCHATKLKASAPPTLPWPLPLSTMNNWL